MQLLFITLILTFIPWMSMMMSEISKEDNQKNISLQYKYIEVLKLSFMFFEMQRSGMLPRSNRISWRGNSGLNDFNFEWDVVGGYYNSGMNYVKSTFQTAFTTTMLVWGWLTWPVGYSQSGRISDIYLTVKWASDYLKKCSKLNTKKFVVQVGNLTLEDTFWGRPEEMYYNRPIITANETHPATNIAAEMVAALAASSIFYKLLLPERGRSCLSHAIHLYDNFVIKTQGSHCDVINCDLFDPDISHEYGDEIAWASLWLYKATNKTEYLNNAEEAYRKYNLSRQHIFPAYDHKGVAVEMLFAELTKKPYYMDRVEHFCDSLLTNKTYLFTKKGLLYVSNRHTLSYAANAAFICLIAVSSDDYENTFEYYTFAKQQINYMLGIGTGRSYVVGYGKNSPTQPCHKAATCSSLPDPCGWQQAVENKPNQHVLYGALVSGPDSEDFFLDYRLSNFSTQFFYTEVNIEYNAGFTSALAGLIELESTKKHLRV